jgi:hypothetical protein
VKLFRRRVKGRHALGAPVQRPAASPESAPRVELTFRDGTSAALDPAQAGALADVARVLTGHERVKG